MTGRGAVVRRDQDWHGSTAVATATAVAGYVAIATQRIRARRARPSLMRNAIGFDLRLDWNQLSTDRSLPY